jgi:universal stress protein E
MPPVSRSAPLFVIVDPCAERQLALEQAVRIAGSAECGIHAFVCVYEPAGISMDQDSRRDQKYEVIRLAESRIESRLQSFRDDGIPCQAEVVWSSSCTDSALRSITRSKYAMVIKSNYDHARAKRIFDDVADFSLMRYSTCPVLFTQRGQAWDSDRLLACVDVDSESGAHEQLNGVIIERAREVARLLGLRLSVAACFRDRVRFRPEVLANRLDVDPELLHLGEGPVLDALQRVCRENDPAVLMLGTLAHDEPRSRLTGSTVARLVDLVDTDIVTVI